MDTMRSGQISQVQSAIPVFQVGDPEAARVRAARSEYPFTSQKAMKARLGSDAIFRVVAVLTMFRLQTDAEQATDSTISRNRAGFMSSDAKRGTLLARRILDGLAGQTDLNGTTLSFMTPDDWCLTNVIAIKYSRQMAQVAQRQEIGDDPLMRAAATIFSVKS